MKSEVIQCYIWSIVILIVLYLTFVHFNKIDIFSIFNSTSVNIYDFYSQNMRGHLFAGFLALGGFLLSLKTFIIVNMKENLFSSEKYIERWEKSVKTNPDLKLYAPLSELSHILYYAIFSCLVAAILQMTLGFFKQDIASLICIYLCISSTVLLMKSLVIIKRNLDTWFEYLD